MVQRPTPVLDPIAGRKRLHFRCFDYQMSGLDMRAKILIPLLAVFALGLALVFRSPGPSTALLRAAEPAASAPAPVLPTPAAPSQDSRLEPAVDPAEIERRFEPKGVKRLRGLPRRVQADEIEETRAAQARATDPSRPEGARVQDLQRLARRDAVTSEIRAAMVALLQDSPSPLHRIAMAEALRERAGHAEVREGLLLRLLGDTHEMVRKRSAEALLDARDDPRVAEALARAAQSDPSKIVRQTAARPPNR